MKKIKKVLAVLLTLAMVMAMSLTTFAATKDSATITVNNAENATLSYVQVIEPDPTSATGWKFSSDTIESAYLSAFGVEDAQVAIVMLIKAEDSNAAVPSAYVSVNAATAAQINQALDNVINSNSITFTAMGENQSVTVTKAGVYAIKASEEGYTYKAMAAYVGFGAVSTEGTSYEYPSLVDATLEAKKITTTVTKQDNDDNNAVVIGQTVTYTVTTSFPYFNQNDTNKVFKICDAIEGASYVGLVDDATTDENEKTATITIGSLSVTDVEFVQNGNEFEINLSDYIDNVNTYAGQTVTVTYQAVVTGVTVENTASSHIGNVITDSNPVEVYTGEIELTKYNENQSVALADAGFKVRIKGETNYLEFVVGTNRVVKNDNEEVVGTTPVYTYNGVKSANGTEITTGELGTLIIEGLDVGTYEFVEVTAPTGYSINETPAEASLSVTGTATAIFTADTSMNDSKLSALPSTGGMGTTLFTIGGCIIMILAAALFFVNRRRSAE